MAACSSLLVLRELEQCELSWQQRQRATLQAFRPEMGQKQCFCVDTLQTTGRFSGDGDFKSVAGNRLIKYTFQNAFVGYDSFLCISIVVKLCNPNPCPSNLNLWGHSNRLFVY